MTEDDLPELREGILSEHQVRRLLADIEQDGEGVEVVVRRRMGAPAESRCDVATAERALYPTDGPPSSVQLRYRLRGVDWWDTLMPTPDGVRLVRMKG